MQNVPIEELFPNLVKDIEIVKKKKNPISSNSNEINRLKADLKKANILNIKLTNELRKANRKISELEEVMSYEAEAELQADEINNEQLDDEMELDDEFD